MKNNDKKDESTKYVTEILQSQNHGKAKSIDLDDNVTETGLFKKNTPDEEDYAVEDDDHYAG